MWIRRTDYEAKIDGARDRARAEVKRELAYLESEVEFWRQRFNNERERADRLQDQLLLIHGEAPATETVREERRIEKKTQEGEDEKRTRELMEITSEQMHETGDGSGMLEAEVGIDLPPEFAAMAESLNAKE